MKIKPIMSVPKDKPTIFVARDQFSNQTVNPNQLTLIGILGLVYSDPSITP